MLEDSDQWSVGKGSVQNRISKLEERGVIESEPVSGYALKSLNEEKEFEVKSVLEDKTLEKAPPVGESGSESEAALGRVAYAKKLILELKNLREWIRDVNLDMTTQKRELLHRRDYEPKDGYAYSHLSESIPDLKDQVEDFLEKVTRQSLGINSYSRLLDPSEKAYSVRRCYSKTSWRSDKEQLDQCLQEEGIDLGEDRHLGRKSDGELAADHTTSVKERLEGLGELVKLTGELEQERGKILEKLNKYIHFVELPQKPASEDQRE